MLVHRAEDQNASASASTNASVTGSESECVSVSHHEWIPRSPRQLGAGGVAMPRSMQCTPEVSHERPLVVIHPMLHWWLRHSTPSHLKLPLPMTMMTTMVLLLLLMVVVMMMTMMKLLFQRIRHGSYPTHPSSRALSAPCPSCAAVPRVARVHASHVAHRFALCAASAHRWMTSFG